MNRIYKVIWSKAKNCYVVASELAKSHTKSPRSSVISRTLVAGVLASVLSLCSVMPVYSGNYVAGKKGDADISLLGSNVIIIDDYDTPLGDDSGTGGSDVTGTTTLPAVVANVGNTNPVSDSTIIGTLAAGGTTALDGSYFFTTNGGHISESTLMGSVTGSGSTFVNTNSGTVNNSSLYGNVSGDYSKLFNSTDASLNNSLYMGSISGNNSSFTSANGGSFNREIIIGNVSSNYSKIRAGGNLPANGSLSDGVVVNNISYSSFNGQDGNSVVSIGTITKNVASSAGITAVSGYGVGVQGNNAVGIGTNYYAGANGVAIGNEAVTNSGIALGYNAKSPSDYSVAIGNNAGVVLGIRAGGLGGTYQVTAADVAAASSSNSAVAIGNSATTFGSSSIAIGNSAFSTGGISLGKGAFSTNGVALGNDSLSIGKSVALGNRAFAGGNNATDAIGSVAIGYNSFVGTNEDGVVSFGRSPNAVIANELAGDEFTNSEQMTRRLINVSRGINDTDVVNVGQLNDALADIDSGNSLDNLVEGDHIEIANNSLDNTVMISVLNDGEVEQGDTGLVTGGQVYTAIQNETRPGSNGNYVLMDNSAADNLLALDEAIKANADAISAIEIPEANIYIAGDGIAIDASNEISVNKDGEIKSGNEGIVTGGQVYDAIQAIEIPEVEPVKFLGVNSTDTSDSNYNGSGAEGTRAIALGVSASATGTDSVAIGTESVASRTNEISVGNTDTKRYLANVADGTLASDASTVGQTGATLSVSDSQLRLKNALGEDLATVTLTDLNTQVTTNNYITVNNEGDGEVSLTINNLDVSNADNITNVGSGEVTGENSTALGTGSVVSGIDSIAIGTGHIVTGNNSGALGDPNIVNGSNSYVIGNNSSVNDADTDGTFVMGNNSRTNTSNTVILGNDNNVGGGATGSWGNFTQEYGDFNSVVGQYNRIAGYSNNVIGSSNQLLGSVYSMTSDEDRPFYSEPYNNTNILGNSNDIEGNNNTVLGNRISYTGDNAVIIGNRSTGVEGAVSVGSATTQRQIKYVADGTDATDVSTIQQTGSSLALFGTTLSLQDATGTTLNSVTLPSGSSNSGAVMYDDNDENSPDYHSTITLEEPTVGAGVKITNLADGSISSASTDAVTGAQLYATNQQINTMQTGISNNASTIAVVQTDVSNLKTNYTTMRSDVNTLQTQVETGFNVNINGAKVKTVNPDSNYINFKSGTNVTLTNDTNSVKIDVPANGTIASGDTGIISGGSVFNETRVASSGNYIQAANTASQNLSALDTAVKGLADNAVTYDSTTKKFSDAGTEITDVTMTGTMTAGTVSATSGSIGGLTIASNQISGLGNATLSANSTEAVNGSQLYTTNQALAQEISDRADADTALSNRIGTISADGNYITIANNVSQNLEALDDAVKDNADDIAQINTDLSGKANVDASNLTGHETEWGTAIGTGAVASGDGKLVTGGTVYDALQAETRPASDGNYITTANTAGANLTALDTAVKTNADAITNLTNTKANTDLDNITNNGETVIKNLAKDAVKVVNGTNTTVTEGTDGDAKTYAVNVNVDGQVAENNTGIVDGGTVYDALEDMKTDIDTDLASKANKDASNVAANTADWGAAIGTGAVASGNGELVTGGTVYDALQAEARPAQDGTYIRTSNTAGANLTALDTAITTLDEGKADTDLGNITDAGKAVIQDATNVVSGDSIINVTSATANGVKTYTVSANISADGAIASGDTGLVSGGTVYTEVRPAQDGHFIETTKTTGENLAALDDAVQDNKDAIDGLDALAVKYDDASKAKITLGGASGTTIDNVADGTLSANSKEAVNGSQLFTTNENLAQEITDRTNADTALSERIGELASDGQYITTTNNVSQNLSALDDAVKDNADAIQQVNTDLTGKANVALDNITDAGKAVVRDLAKESVKVVNGTNTTVTEGEDGVAKTYAINVTVDGQVADGNTGIVDGGTVYDAIQDAKDDIDDKLDTKANKDASNVATETAKWGEAIGTGAVEANNGELVTGGTVYDALMTETRPGADGTYIKANDTAGTNLTALDTAVKTNADNIAQINTDLSGKANIALDNINADGKSVITGLTDIVSNDDYLSVTSSKDDAGKKTYNVGLIVNGSIADGNTGLVTGGDVYNAIQASNLTAGDNIEIVEGKINAVGLVKYDDDSKATVTMEGTRGTKLTNLKAAALTRTSSDAVIGSQLFATNTNIEGFARDIRTNSDNITALTTSVTNALNSVSAVSTTVDTVMNLAADKSLNNLSDTGKQVIANAAANAVQEYMRANGGNGGVTGSGLLGGSNGTLNASQPRMLGLMASPATLNAQPTNNDEIVTNSDDLNNDNNTINQATQDALDTKAEIADVEAAFDGVNQKLDEKADVTYVDDELAKKADLSYVDDKLSKKADKEELDAKADKTELEAKAETDASNIDVAKWSEKLGTGAIAEGDGNLVTGGVVFDAIQNISGNDMMKVEDNAIRIGGSTKYDAQDTIDVSKSDGTGRVITGVMTDVNDPSSVANVGYVNALNENIIQGVNRGFSKLDDKINKTGAGAAALANLHPLDYDPDQKFNISAAYGNYHGTSAGAVGVFYRPSEQVMINASSTIGDGNTMFGAGVTFAVDKPAAGGLSKVQMAKTINQQSQVINAQAQEITAQAQELQNVKAELAEIRQMLQEKK